MDYVFAFNVFEAVLWTSIGLFAVGRSVRQRERRRQLLAIAVLFFGFAVSEVVETQTGAWWKPWWLAVWKGGCIALLIVLGRQQLQWQKQQQQQAADDPVQH